MSNYIMYVAIYKSFERRDIMHYSKEIARMGGINRNISNVVTRASRLTKDKEAEQMLVLFYYLISYTNFLNPIVFDHFILRKDVKLVASLYNKSAGAIYKTICREYRKLDKYINHDLLEIVKDAVTFKSDIRFYKDLFNEMINEYSPKLINNSTRLFTFDIEKVAILDRQYNHQISNEHFSKIVNSLKYTSKPFLEEKISKFDKRDFGYIIHLLNGSESNLTKNDLRRKLALEHFLMFNTVKDC